MIEPMIRYNFLLYHADVEAFMNRLQDMGVVDITVADWEASEEQRNAILGAERYKTTYQEMASVDTEEAEEKKVKPFETVQEAVEAFLQAKEKKEDIATLQAKAVTELDQLEAWGEFDPELIKRLKKEEGITLRFFETSEKQYKQEWEELYPIEVVNRLGGAGGQIYFVLAQTREMEEDEAPLVLDATEHKAPTMTYSQKELQIERYLEDEKEQEEIMARAALSQEAVQAEYLEMKDRISFTEAVNAGENYADGMIKIVEGWSVADDRRKVEELADTFDGEGVVYTSEKAVAEHNPPVKLKNRFFPKLFESIGSLYMTPSYNELDLTPFFAPFYMVFFGMCLGDAGYGALFMLTTIIFWKKIPEKFKKVGWLVIFLSIATIFWGLLTGNVFGIELVKIEALSAFKDYFVTSDTMFYVALALGVVQILCGQTIKMFNQIKRGGSFKYGLSQLGWLILLYSGTVYFISTLTTAFDMPIQVLYALLGVAGVLIFFFHDPKKNPFVNVGLGLYDCYNMATGLIGDLMSYIRLFALALSGSIIAQVFNELAVGLGMGIPGIGILVTILILLIGHGLTIFVSALGAFVHPVRLTFVEFYKNAGFEGAGRAFSPLKRMKTKN